MDSLRLFFLGPPQIERSALPVEVDTRKAIALLAYLAHTREPQTRERLAGLLYPDYDDAHARGALRRTLSSLRHAIGDDRLATDRGWIGLRPGSDLWLDVDQFRAHLAECRTHRHGEAAVCPACLASLEAAVALYRDDFLAGFSLRDSSEFDEWQFFQAESLRHDLTSALERLVRGYVAQVAYTTAIPHARRWLSLDTLHEPAHCWLMQLYAWTGEYAAALRQYRECVRILDAELGVPPLPETTALYTSILERRAVPALPAAPPPVVATASRARAVPFPLTGRQQEWTALQAAYMASRQQGQFVVLAGEPGIGKTRLLDELLHDAQAQGSATLTLRAYEGESTLAYGPWLTGLRSCLAETPAQRLATVPGNALSETARLLPELATRMPGLPPTAPLNSPGAQARFLDGITRVVLALLNSPAPGVLAIDDVQWADEASLDLLTYLVRRLRDSQLLVVAALRRSETAASDRIEQLVSESQRAGRGRLLTLTRWTAEEITQLVLAANLFLEPGVTTRLFQETEGLPFFVTEFLTAGTNRQDWDVPASVRALLHARLTSVDETSRQLLATAAIIGRSFDFDILRAVSGRGEDEAVACLERLLAQGLIAEVRAEDSRHGASYDFYHDQLRRLVLEETSLVRQRLLHRRVADALVDRARRPAARDTLAGQIAQHYQLAGQHIDAATYYVLAGEHARRTLANAEALADLRAALTLGHPDSATIHEAIGDLETLAGRYTAAELAYELAAAQATGAWLARLERKLGQVHQRRGEYALAEIRYQSALNVLGPEGDPGELARLTADWSLAAHHQNAVEQATALAIRSLHLAQAAGDRPAQAQAHNILGILARSRGELADALHHLTQSLGLAEELADPGAQIAALNNLALAHHASGDSAQAATLAARALVMCETQGDRHRAAALHNNLADFYHAQGQSDAAMQHLKQAVSLFAEIGDPSVPASWQPEIWKLVEW